MRVVGAALLRDGLLLAAQRSEPEAMRGLWEFPGGKVKVGESDEQALTREIGEELGAAIRVGDAFGEVEILDGAARMTVYLAELVEGEPSALEHLSIRWVGATGARALNWIPADVPLVEGLVESGLLR